MSLLPQTPAPWIRLTGAVALALASGWLGWKVRDADYQRFRAAQERDAKAQVQAARKLEGENERIVVQVRDRIVEKKAEAEVVYRQVTKEVPRYVTRTVFEDRVVAGGGLPSGFVWLYNQSIANDPTASFPPGLDPDAPTGLGMSALAETLARNNTLLHQCRAENQGWKDWYLRVEAEWPKPESAEEDRK